LSNRKDFMPQIVDQVSLDNLNRNRYLSLAVNDCCLLDEA